MKLHSQSLVIAIAMMVAHIEAGSVFKVTQPLVRWKACSPEERQRFLVMARKLRKAIKEAP